jgi:hypothetical protein
MGKTTGEPSSGEVTVSAPDVIVNPTVGTDSYTSSYKYETALGHIPGSTTWNSFGYNSDVSVGTEIVATRGGTFTPMKTASTLTIVSSSSQDSSGGTGASSVIIYGLDVNRLTQLQVITLTGTTPVVTTTSWLGVNRIAVYLSGASVSNVGTITCTATVGGLSRGIIQPTDGTTQMSLFYTQAGHTALLDWATFNADRIAGGQEPIIIFKVYVYSAVSGSRYLVARLVIHTVTTSFIDLNPSQPLVIGESSCIWVEATTDKDATEVSSRLSLIERAN